MPARSGERSPLFTGGEVARAAEGRLLAGAEAVIAGAVSDSRRVQPGDLFVAIRGERVDGHDFVPKAVALGAAAVLVERVDPAWDLPDRVAVIQVEDVIAALGRLARYHRRRFPVRMTAVTGSVGKTTTKDLIAAVLSQGFRLLKTEGNLNTEIGLPLTLLRLAGDTEAAVVEMGMRGPGQIRYLASLAEPAVGVITNIGRTHLELLGSEENIALAKAELAESLPPDGVAVLNADDRWTPFVAERTRARTLRFGWERQAKADVYAEEVRSFGAGGTSFRLFAPQGSAAILLSLPGRHNVSNALAAAAVGLVWGLSLEQIAVGLASARISDKRMHVIEAGPVTILDDTYNASPVSTRAALEVLAGLRGGSAAAGSGEGGAGASGRKASRTVAVLGNMLELGEYAREGHREVGRAAADLGVDLLVCVGDLAADIAGGAREAGMSGGIRHVADRQAAASLLLDLVRPGDAVLVKGSRGMAMEELVAVLQQRFGDASLGADAVPQPRSGDTAAPQRQGEGSSR